MDFYLPIDMVKLLKQNDQSKKTVETDFILAHNLYARAEIPPSDKVIIRTKIKFI